MHDLVFADVGAYRIRIGVSSPKGLLVVAGRDNKPIGRMSCGKVVVLAGKLPVDVELPGWIYPDPVKFVEQDRRAFCPLPFLQVVVECRGEYWDWHDPRLPMAFAHTKTPRQGLAYLDGIADSYMGEVLVPHFEEVLDWEHDHPGETAGPQTARRFPQGDLVQLVGVLQPEKEVSA